MAVGQYMRGTKTVAVGPPLDHRHEGLTRGERTLHRHVCLWCDEVFEHTHVIKTVQESVHYPQLCGKCDPAGTQDEIYSIRVRDRIERFWRCPHAQEGGHE